MLKNIGGYKMENTKDMLALVLVAAGFMYLMIVTVAGLIA
ncbi:hypothetical protein C1G86_0299 [Dehalococcoides mccartyi]|jgi:hypothetical protein|uniref:Uncharacterized protein n=2 Tax=Dehalococcoides mccartyi TaxID=61435 RepID=A0A142V929_9CHLR|nr:hypothetical protein X794_01180 [Dehalococcoides mccartyi CG5]AMU86121.1 hypothetical protein Dm11a5_0292 [Dehalococcoides mccartyi]CAI82519.1 hypothetical protein cbdbA288 [Dehalococcoides mccartyi CBDB1]AOV98964.1 hypothetical protein DCWBC2_0292 [Dehalococcoides mccartyi]MBA2084730.1 hypothetical protein [Dehalococcoides mccartyi]